MAAPARNLVNLNSVGKEYSSRTILEGISLGISAGDRIGIVGRNGDGKTTLLRMIAGLEQPDSGAVIRTDSVDLAIVDQRDTLNPEATIRDELVAGRDDHEWAGNSRFRSVMHGLLGGVELSRFSNGLGTVIGTLSGGERRRVALAQKLIDNPELLLLDEPTNHLDIDAVTWLAGFLAARRGTLVVITHDRWFLDEVCTQTWEVADQSVMQYEGGYAAYVLARAERDRQEATRDAKRRQLVRKELAWLRRGPPARTSKPKFRMDAAYELIADEPPPRDSVELLKFATARLGKKVIEAIDVTLTYGERQVISPTTWRLGPGDRVALVGTNGAGKTSLVKIMCGLIEPTSGHIERGATVRIAQLSQDTAEIPGHLRVQESLEAVRSSSTTQDGYTLTAGQLCERFGFRGSRAGTLVKNLSGGERRRLQLMRLLMEGPNVLVLDEPTNDLDIDTLTAIEDLLDSWPGTLIVISHDRYFVERVCDNVYAVTGEGTIRHLPGGIDQYIVSLGDTAGGEPGVPVKAEKAPSAPSGGDVYKAKKEIKRVERALEKLITTEAALQVEMADASADFERLRALDDQLKELIQHRATLEASWLELSSILE